MNPEPQTFPPISELLKRQGIWLSKKKSQHFLRSQEACAQIAELAGLTNRHLAIEVGAGLGNLTVELSARAGQVCAVEMDRTFEEWHEYLASSYGSIRFLYEDFLKVSLEKIVESHDGPVCGVGNLPYQITSEVLFRFVDSPLTFQRLVFMVQREVADRVAAGPANRSAGALTYKIALRYRARTAMTLEPGAFLPPPKVKSAVLVLEPMDEPLYRTEEERGRVYTLVDRIFQYRRKTLGNALRMGELAPDREEAERVLRRAGVEARRRPETLEIDEALAIARVLAGEDEL